MCLGVISVLTLITSTNGDGVEAEKREDWLKDDWYETGSFNKKVLHSLTDDKYVWIDDGHEGYPIAATFFDSLDGGPGEWVSIENMVIPGNEVKRFYWPPIEIPEKKKV